MNHLPGRLSRPSSDWRPLLRHVSATAIAGLVVLSAGLSPSVAEATVVHSPPWADSFGAKWDGTNGLDTRASALWMKTKLGAKGYTAYTAYGYAASTSMGSSYAQSDAVWAMFGHANRGFITQYAGSTSTVLHAVPNGTLYSCSSPHACLSNYGGGKISKMKLMVFGGCYTALAGNDSLPYSADLGIVATQADGVSTAVGFDSEIFWPPMDKWSEVFFGDLAAGHDVSHALILAADQAAISNGGNYGGTNYFDMFGSTTTTVVPAGYGS